MFLNLLVNLRQDKLVSGTRKTWQLNTGETTGLKAIYQGDRRSGLRYWTDLRKYARATLLRTSGCTSQQVGREASEVGTRGQGSRGQERPM